MTEYLIVSLCNVIKRMKCGCQYLYLHRPDTLHISCLFQGSGLSSLLPQPKHMTRKAMDRSLIPHTLTKRQPPKGPKPGTPAQGLLGSSASPSAIKAAAKSAALQVARQIATDDQDNEEDISPQNYFSLAESSQPLPAVIPSLDPEPGPPAEPLAPAPAPADEPGQSDAPLDFGAGGEGAGPWGAQYPQYQQEMEGTDAPPQVIRTPEVLFTALYMSDKWFQILLAV